MPQFAFTAKDRLGNTIQGKVAADSMTLATGQVEQMGYSVLSVQAVPDAAGSPPPPPAPAPAYGQSVAGAAAQPTATFPSPLPGPQQAVSEPTRVMPAPPPGAPPAPQPATPTPPVRPDVLADAEKRRKVEADLKKIGMSPDEIRRLINADAASYDTPVAPLPPPVSPPSAGPTAAPKRAKRDAAAASLQSFAAELMTSNAAKNKQAVQNVNLDLPPFRESSTQEKIQAEALLREASMLRRRERYREAEAKCREAINLTPSDAAALELLGDLLQGVARTDEALAAYKRATEADAKRSSAEKKYADLLTRQQNWGNYNPEEPPRNVLLTMVMSALLPGAGQLFCGQWTKGIFFLIATAVCTYLLAWSPFGFQGERIHTHINTSLIVCTGLSLVLYIVCLIDARSSALNYGKRGGASGWEV
ncbi:MAG TPA: hypothetical protein VKU00_22765 [Chthonomonadaceae bacterium]|nr:hypothetical protein [Chthonomonadaceae bacterium]